MIEYGCITNDNCDFSHECIFALENGFGIRIKYNNPISVLKKSKIPILIHAVFGIEDHNSCSNKLFDILKELNHISIIIHPILKNNNDSGNYKKLRGIMEKAYSQFIDNGIEVYVENNCRIQALLYKPYEIEYFFNSECNFRFLLDIAHIDSYNHLQEIIDVQYPDMLHIADKHFNVEHEHLPIGQGEIDFNGKIIFEIAQGKEEIKSSQLKMKEIINNIRK